MPTATLTWSSTHPDSALQSTFAATNQGAIQLLNAHFTAQAVFSDFPWEVCSFEGTTAPWFVTLKRKNATPGRIVFVGVTSAPGVTYNPQFGNNINWSAVGVRAAFFPAATSDTPANILATSGDVFTNPSGGSGFGPSAALTTGANSFSSWACEDGVFLRYGTSTTTTNLYVVGALMEDDAGAEAPISIGGTSATLIGIAPTVSPTVTASGGFALQSGASIHFGSGWEANSGVPTYLRDNGSKLAWFLPKSLCSFSLPLGQAMKYKLRQIATGPIPLAAYEQLTDTGAVLKAISTSPSTTSGLPWLTNFKV